MTASNNMLYTHVVKSDEEKTAFWEGRVRKLTAEAQAALAAGDDEAAAELVQRARTCERALICSREGRRPTALSRYRHEKKLEEA